MISFCNSIVGVKTRFEHNRLISHMRVIDGEICVRDKEFKVLDDLFSTRFDLHLKGLSVLEVIVYSLPLSLGWYVSLFRVA